jgi:DtxR family transcriptional regulator, Mn-dependent transcriptional regulator
LDLSDAIQDYLKAIYKLEVDSEGRVPVTALARSQGVAPASASEMVKKLAALGLADNVPYKGVTLTPAGRRVALEVIRHHRLLELYLAQTLGLSIESVHEEADRLEHVLSDELEARIDQALGYPTHDPHGEPIPTAELEMGETEESRPLSSLGPGEQAVVVRVPDDEQLLPRLAELGLVPGRSLEVRTRDPLVVVVDDEEHAVAPELASAVRVS